MSKRRIGLFLCLILILLPSLAVNAHAAPVDNTPSVSITYNTGSYPGKPQLSWNAVDNVSTYQIYRATRQDGPYTLKYTTANHYYINTDALHGTTYYYQVAAVAADGSLQYSAPVHITTACAAPTVHIGLTNSAHPGKPQLKWSAVTGAKKYQIYRATSKSGSYSLYYTTEYCSFTNISAVSANKYYYKVAALNAAGASDFSNVVSATAGCSAPKVSYTFSSGTYNGSTYTHKPKLTWNAVDGATSYKIYRATSKNGPYSLRLTTKNLHYTNVDAQVGYAYYYKVWAVNSAGIATASSPIQVAMKCAAPEVSITRVNGIYQDQPYVGKPKLSWLIVSGAKSYQVYRSTAKDGNYTLLDTTSKTYYTNTSTNSGTTYYYKIKAVGKNTAANSSFSSIKSLTTSAATPQSKIPSKTYSIKVNYTANTVTVYTYDASGNYTVPVKAMICSTGSATPRSGTYSLASTGKWEWQPLFGNVYGHYTTQITGNILFHSVPYTQNHNRNALEYWEFDKLGTSASMGCVRLQVKDSYWIYSHKNSISSVTFYGSSDPGPLGKPTAPKISDYTSYRGWDPSDPNSANPWRNAKVTVGGYVGMSESAAIKSAGEDGFSVAPIAYQHSSRAKGTVIAQSLTRGSTATMNATITLTVSAG